jgi:REP element-mobilizing transposase RayT
MIGSFGSTRFLVLVPGLHEGAGARGLRPRTPVRTRLKRRDVGLAARPASSIARTKFPTISNADRHSHPRSVRSRCKHRANQVALSLSPTLGSVMLCAMPRRSRQLDLELREAPRWGGRRAGAGRKRGANPRDSHRTRPTLSARFPCHVTLKVRRGLPSLRTVRLVRELERSLAAACERGRFRVAHYSIQHDHVHLIVEAAGKHALACGMKSIAARVARAANRIFQRRGPVLADRYHRHTLRTPREVRSAIAYVLLNARRHLVKIQRRAPPARVDPASSGRWFAGWIRRIQPASSTDPPPISAPRTWLLALGWRRHGLIDPSEVPGPPS